jgi:lyso-ornithine lipid O-acyltransferase
MYRLWSIPTCYKRGMLTAICRNNVMDTPMTPFPKSRLRALVRVVLLVVITISLVIPAFILWCLTIERPRARIAQWFLVLLSRVMGLQVKITGTPTKDRPLMLVANHSSYLDIMVLGSLMPLSFTPKKEIRRWPVIGFLGVLADSVFIERRPADMQRVQSEMASRFASGKVLGLFPEGTTGDGFHVMPFKSGFLSLAEDYDLPIQPISICYQSVAGIPLSAATRDQVAWIGEATLVAHLWRLFQFPNVQVGVTFYAVERIANHENRKALAKSCENTIRNGLTKALEAAGVTG